MEKKSETITNGHITCVLQDLKACNNDSDGSSINFHHSIETIGDNFVNGDGNTGEKL